MQKVPLEDFIGLPEKDGSVKERPARYGLPDEDTGMDL